MLVTMSMRKQERQVHYYDPSAKNDGIQTNPREEHRQRLKKVACNEAQTHYRKPFAHNGTFFWQDVCTLFSSAATEEDATNRLTTEQNKNKFT